MYRMFWGACESVQISRFREKIQFDSHVVAVTVIFVAHPVRTTGLKAVKGHDLHKMLGMSSWKLVQFVQLTSIYIIFS